MTTSYSIGQIWWAIKGWVQINIPNSAKGWPVQYNNLTLFTNNIYDRCWNINYGLILPSVFFQFEVSCCRPAPKAWLCKGPSISRWLHPSLHDCFQAHPPRLWQDRCLQAGLSCLCYIFYSMQLCFRGIEKVPECKAGLSQTTALGKCCNSRIPQLHAQTEGQNCSHILCEKPA